MDYQSSDNVEVALIQHQLLRCNAEAKIKPSPEMGGYIEISANVDIPKKPSILNKDDEFAISVQIGVTGKVKDSKDIAFNVSCEMEGSFRLINCDDKGIPVNKGLNLWILSTRQLFPLVAQYTTDLVSRLGFKNINVPTFVPSQFLLRPKPVKKTSAKSKK